MRLLFRLFIILIGSVLLIYAVLLLFSGERRTLDWGVSFSKEHASWLGLDWQRAYRDILTDLKPEYVRLSALWNSVEKEEGTFDFKDMDLLMNESKKYGTKVVLVMGQKAPRWPECHIPDWAMKKDVAEREAALLKYVETVVKRYKDHAALELWQVENEPFIHFDFGDCAVYDQDAIYKEIALVKTLDDKHQVVVTDSGELGWWKKASEAGDIFGTTLYRSVRMPSGRYWTYDWLPAGYYRLRAKIFKIPSERFFISELQAEPWISGGDPRTADVGEMEYSLNIGRLEKNMSYAEYTGATRAYLWGAEWWYWMKTEKKDTRYWDAVKDVFEKARKEREELRIKN